MKYLKVGVSGPYINTERVGYFEVPDDFDPEGKDFDEANQYVEDEINNYVESWCEVVDPEDVPEDERP
ncbi:hypothetical protein KGG72_gp55 [Streptomyces phage Salutena]|uniref:Uncharacterized protein n=1 Tax=Streptomyces phage Salutena TaxID=2767576 RepID=A0A7S6R713_9CAUD|nr:hypothetical protein KGG72_gp55 [Streptomyces phage Salutena]QOV06185.1 hypothetical protein CPT_Salutena_055 [Streptomyces phage Salutena]